MTICLKLLKNLQAYLAMLKKTFLLCLLLSLILPFAGAEAAQKKTHRINAKHEHVKTHVVIHAKQQHKLEKVSHSVDAFKEGYTSSGEPKLASAKALVMDQATGEILYGKNIDKPTPIASVTKLMTAMVMLDAHLPMDETLAVTEADVDKLKGSSSKLPVGSELTRQELLHMALMSSENRAASALGRNYPGGESAFVAAMNAKANALGMHDSHFVDPTGLNSNNVSTAIDLAKMVRAAYNYPQIRQVSTSPSQEFNLNSYRHPVNFSNTNLLVRNSNSKWVIGLSKTGYISEAGRCLVMQAEISGKGVVLVFLDSMGKLSRIGDAERIRKWMEHNGSRPVG